MTKAVSKKTRESNCGLYKLTMEQEDAIKTMYRTGDTEKLSKIEKLVSKRKLYELTKDEKYAPKNKSNLRNRTLNEILFHT